MRLKRTVKPGQCAAMRCTKSHVEGGTLCERHSQEPEPAADLAVVRTELVPMVSNARKALDHVRALPVQGPAQIDHAVKLQKGLTEAIKALKARQAEITRPLLTALESARDLFREPIGLAEEGKTVLKGKIESALHGLREAEVKVLEAGEIPETFTQKPKGWVERPAYSFEVLDEAAVPEILKSIDRGKVLSLIESTHGGQEIPGIKVIVEMKGFAR